MPRGRLVLNVSPSRKELLLSPRFFKKKVKGRLLSPPSVRPSVRLSVRPSVMLSPPKPLDEIQPNLVCELRKKKFGPAPWDPGEGSKGQISFNFKYKVNYKDFYSKLCVCFHK